MKILDLFAKPIMITASITPLSNQKLDAVEHIPSIHQSVNAIVIIGKTPCHKLIRPLRFDMIERMQIRILNPQNTIKSVG